eukprot:3658933-Rhodomonas_salina.1
MDLGSASGSCKWLLGAVAKGHLHDGVGSEAQVWQCEGALLLVSRRREQLVERFLQHRHLHLKSAAHEAKVSQSEKFHPAASTLRAEQCFSSRTRDQHRISISAPASKVSPLAGEMRLRRSGRGGEGDMWAMLSRSPCMQPPRVVHTPDADGFLHPPSVRGIHLPCKHKSFQNSSTLSQLSTSNTGGSSACDDSKLSQRKKRRSGSSADNLAAMMRAVCCSFVPASIREHVMRLMGEGR